MRGREELRLFSTNAMRQQNGSREECDLALYQAYHLSMLRIQLNDIVKSTRNHLSIKETTRTLNPKAFVLFTNLN